MKEYDNNNEFDRLVRSTIESGREEIPAGLWSGVERRLPASGAVSRRPVFMHLIRTSAAVIAAASIAVGVIFTSRQRSEAGRFDILGIDPVLTEVPSITCSEVPSPDRLPEIAGRVPSSVTDCPSPACMEITEGFTSAEEEPANTGKSQEEPSVNGSEPANSVAARPLADDFPADPDEQKRPRRTSVSLGAYTNAASNGTSTKTGAVMMKRPGNTSESVPRNSVSETSAPIYGIPVSAGLSARINFTERWGLGVGISYSYLSSRFDGVYTKEDGTKESFKNIRNELHYIGIPVNVFFNVVSSEIVDFYTFAGGTVEKGLSNKYRMVSPENGTFVHKEKIDGFQYSAGLGLGVEFNVTRHFGIYVDPSIRYYFNTGQPHSIRTQQPFLAQLDLGFRVNF